MKWRQHWTLKADLPLLYRKRVVLILNFSYKKKPEMFALFKEEQMLKNQQGGMYDRAHHRFEHAETIAKFDQMRGS